MSWRSEHSVSSIPRFLFCLLFCIKAHQKRARKKAILIGGLILYGALFLIIFKMSFTTLLLYGVFIAIGYPVLLVPYVSLTYDVIGRARLARKARIEYIVLRELFLNAGRIVSILCFLVIVTLFKEKVGILTALVLLGAYHPLIYYFIKDIRLDTETSDETVEEDRQKQAAEPNFIKGER